MLIKKQCKSAKLPWHHVFLSWIFFVFPVFFYFFVSFVLFVFFVSFVLFVFLSFCLFCLLVFFVFSSRHHSDQMSEGSQVWEVTLCVETQKWQSVTESPRSGIELPGQLNTNTQIHKYKECCSHEQCAICRLVLGWGNVHFDILYWIYTANN